MLSLSDFDYPLPKGLIAQEPLANRDSSKLLIIDRESNSILHRQFTSVVEYLDKGDCLVLNDTRVVPARIYGKRKATGANVELLLLERISDVFYRALVKPALKLGDEVSLDGGSLNCKVVDRLQGWGIKLESRRWDDILPLGRVPLPPYIKRLPKEEDIERYQTVYAKNKGAVAAPTAGLHFTKEILQRLEDKGVRVTYLTLHIGYGTFKPVRCEDIRSHNMEKEYFEISEETIRLVRDTKDKGKRVVAAGTTTCRALETLAGPLCAFADILRFGGVTGYTDLFIYPPYRFQVVDALLTNFHLPKTTLLMLVCAFAENSDFLFEAYRQAVEKQYRFYSYGDAMLII